MAYGGEAVGRVDGQVVFAWGGIPGEQVTPGALWQIRITDELRARFVEKVTWQCLKRRCYWVCLDKLCCNV